MRAVACLVRSITHNGFTLARALKLGNQWSCVVGNGPVGVLDWEHLVGGSIAGLDEFGARVDASIDKITEFVQQVVLHRRDFAIREVLEDPLVHPYRWLRPDLVPPAPFVSCDPKDTVDDSGVLVEPHAIDEQFRKPWMPFFCRGARGSADLDAFRAVAEDLTPLFDEVNLPPCLGTCSMILSRGRSLLLGVWIAGVGGNSRRFRLLGLIGWRLSSLWWRNMGFGLMACWMPTLP